MSRSPAARSALLVVLLVVAVLLLRGQTSRVPALLEWARANGVVFLSGDIHYAELSKYALNLPYPMWELTSSGLTEEWRIPTPNANRASEVIADANFGHIDIDWKGAATSLRCGITDHRGAKRLDFTIPLAELVVRP